MCARHPVERAVARHLRPKQRPSSPSRYDDRPLRRPLAGHDNPDNWPEERRLAMLDHVIANQKKNDEGESVYEHIEKKEIRKSSATDSRDTR